MKTLFLLCRGTRGAKVLCEGTVPYLLSYCVFYANRSTFFVEDQEE